VYAEYRTYSPLDLTVSRIEVVQATQDVSNTVPLVEGKSTVARVFLNLGSESSAIQPPLVRAVLRAFDAGGGELPGSPIPAENAPLRAPNRPQRESSNDSLNFRLPRDWTSFGTIRLRAEVNSDGSVAETDRTNNTREVSVSFQPRGSFEVRWIPINYDDGSIVEGPSNALGVYDAKMRKMFPVADEGMTYSRLKEPDWTWALPLRLQTNQDLLITYIRKRYELLADASIDQLVVWLPELNAFGDSLPGGLSDPLWCGADCAGTTVGRVSWIRDDFETDGTDVREGWTATTLAHEIGHNLGLRHTNTRDCNDCEDPHTDWPDPTSGTVHEVGFDTVKLEAKPSSFYDFMTYVEPSTTRWVSPFHFEKLFNGYLLPRFKRAAEAAAETFAIVGGSARRDGSLGRLDPLVFVTSSVPAEPSVASGSHCIRFSSSSATLSDYCFSPTFELHPGHTELEEQTFALRVPFPSGATRVSLRRGETELASKVASANAPSVAITSPASGDRWEGRRTLAWRGSDPDGDRLVYTVMYSYDGGVKWIPIETDTTATEFALETALIGSGTQVFFRVQASDGFRTAEATVGPLTVIAAPSLRAQENADFGRVALGTFGETRLLLSNWGERPATITAVRSSLGDFAVRETLPLVVAPDGNREVVVRFTPASEGVRSATLSFESDDPAHRVVAATVIGSALPDPQISVAPAALEFGSVSVGASRDLTARVRNTGRGTLTILAIGTSSSQFVAGQTTPVSIAEGAEIAVNVTFRPAAVGGHTASLSLTSSAGGGTLISVTLSGTATGTGTGCAVALSPATLSLPASGGSGSITVSAPAGCSWSVASGSDWLTLAPPGSGAGNGAISSSAGPNVGPPRSTTVMLGDASVVILQAGGAELLFVPAVASTPGALGSFFKTGAQLHNPTSNPISGRLLFHAGGISGSENDPVLGYQLAPGETASFDDLLPAFRVTGLGSADLIPRTGTAPVATFRIFNDAGEAGTTGMSEELVRPGEALEAGKVGVLIAPPEPSRARFNIGVRSLGFGAAIDFTVRDANGAVRTTGSKFFAPSYFAQQAADAFLGIALLANDTISFAVTGGSVIIYGATTDNTTQDPSLQFARALRPGSDPRRTIAAVAAAPGVNESLFKTTLQLHNPGGSTISGRLIFHPAATSGSDADPFVPYSLGPRATVSYPDILAVFQRTGLGSLDLVATTGPVPLAVARVFNDGGARGTTGFSVDALRPDQALQAGETGVLIAPADPAATRFNVGIRTLAAVSLTIVVRNRDGQVVRTESKFYPANYFEQVGGAAFAGGPIGPNDTVAVTVNAGSAIVYGAATDNKTQDPAMQVARAIGR
jgi:hypothetical protein